MALLFNSRTLTLDENGVLSFIGDGAYSFEYKRFIQVLLESGQTTNLTQEQYDSVLALDIGAGAHVTLAAGELQGLEISRLDGTLDITGVDFTEAGASGGFETSIDLDSLLGSAIDVHGAGEVAARLTVDGSKAEAFNLLWDYLDDAYVAGNNAFDLDLNANFVRLGVEYVNYLEAGGEPLTFTVAKFTADDGDANTTPERMQSMHDNLLGNLDGSVLAGRFGSDPTLLAELQALVPDEYEARPWFSGNENHLGGADHDGARAFDYDKGWDRPDYLDRFLGEVDARAQDPIEGDMIFGDGNSAVNYAVTRHEGAGVELALKAKIRGVGDYDSAHTVVNGDGTVTYLVDAGEGAPGRTTWNVDWAATVTEAGDDEDGLSFKFLLDVDPTAGENFVDVLAFSLQNGNEYTPGQPGVLQNSYNYGFLPDDVFDPVNGEGTFTARLEAYDDGGLIAEQTIYIEATDAFA
jgi:hypothetical protein